ncbi:uncharacterized protein PHACADRAFT_208465 [Phanerochaete carnosa HHB-10118-sp]|uniref:AB hydrolase-1 domain-containing protein n=1 Tax=Phanerochaete carnosa (strain HHB-10118-sp) TaxID=650164 RepID=K5W0Q7_PHACS|nr:uncharacterized protein PHACADRAFT_208465 [Phanerochaete carnosa HHB-10118-sp]EKM57398.1 hypothetical protein PHACADRAFT_208465 [Phanerochaete carnosa HHB-10118-sp]
MRYFSALATVLLALHHGSHALMDPSLYKNAVTSRNLTYHYYFSPAQPEKPTLLLCHGIPSTSYDWRYIVPVLEEKGYGVLAPDMLGLGETAKPADPAAYVPSLISKDLVDLLDAESLGKVIAIGHDWGCKAISRLANYYPERFLAYAFLAVPFAEITPPTDFQMYLDYVKRVYGYELYGYWSFFSAPDANELIQVHVDSFVSVAFPYDPTIWKTRWAPTGVLRQSLLEGYVAPLPAYMSEEDKEHFVGTFSRNGFEAPANWYKIMTSQLSARDDEQIPYERALPPASAPIYFAATKYDYVCLPEIGYAVFEGEEFSKHNVTHKEYDTDHWIILSKGDEVAHDLDAWIEGTAVSQASH